MGKSGLWILMCAAIGLLLLVGGSFATVQNQNTNSNANQNSNRNANSNMRGNMNSGNMNSGNMNAGNMNRDSDSNMNANTGGEMDANMNANMQRDQNMNANTQNMNANTGGGDRMMALNSTDRKFIMEAAAGGMAEVAMARVALERASSEGVKSYAQKMIDDHTKANEELMAVAQSKGVTLPSGPNAKQQAMMDKMMRLSGAEFERQYIMMAGNKDHEKMVKLFQDEIRKGRDAEVKAFASKTLPTVQEHLRMARDMQGPMNMRDGGNMNSNRNMNSNSNGNSNR